MFNIKTLNKIAACGLSQLDKAKYSVSDSAENPDGIILRSFSMHDMELPSNLLAVARAGAGTNNIPIDKCTEKGIVVFNTPGANANAVKELVIAGLLLSSRKIVDGISWAKNLKDGELDIAKQVEKGKSSYAGPEIQGKTLAVIGTGAIGVLVANAACALGMNVIGFDPYISVKAALGLSRQVSIESKLNTVLAKADYVTVHVPLIPDTKGMIGKDAITSMKDGARILNFARGGLVDNAAVAEALESGKISCYITDFPDSEVLKMKNVVAIPHLGASTPESEDNCAVMAAQELSQYLEFGTITNSVNFPNCDAVLESKHRITVAHKNMPNMLKQFLDILSQNDINVEHMVNKCKGDNAYAVLDTDNDVPADMIKKISTIEGVFSARLVK